MTTPARSQRTQVVIVGGGPAGSLLSHLLRREGVDSVVLERQSREHVLGRIRAGVLEAGTVRLLTEAGLGERLHREGFTHGGVTLAFGGEQLRIDLARLTGEHLTVYGQTEVQRDLYAALDAEPGRIVFEAHDVTLEGVDGDAPAVTYVAEGTTHRIACDWIAGCDGFHGVSRASIPAAARRTYERVEPFGWLGVLSRTPPVADELIYARHDEGFALCSMRNEQLSRYYVQCPLDDTVADWPDERFWATLCRRLPDAVAEGLVTGPSIETSIAPLRSFVAEPMRHGRLLLAGDAAHIVPPTGAKGLNLALRDVAHLAQALADQCLRGSSTGVDGYSAAALTRAWRAMRFSWWLTSVLHRFPDRDDFSRRIQEAELSLLASSEAARAAFAASYVGAAG